MAAEICHTADQKAQPGKEDKEDEAGGRREGTWMDGRVGGGRDVSGWGLTPLEKSGRGALSLRPKCIQWQASQVVQW